MAGPSKDWCKMNWAAPSCAIAGNIRENQAFLKGKTPGIGLCLFETEACLAYEARDLPAEPGAQKWHVHLPLDLPWEKGAEAVAEICGRLYAKIAWLAPEVLVLHPPAEKGRELLAGFSRAWQEPAKIALENIACSDVAGLNEGDPDFLDEHGFEFCLDVAHLLCYGQWRLLESGLPGRAMILHWSAPETADRHLPLTRLAGPELTIAREIMARTRADAIHLLEIFDWQGIAESLPVLSGLARGGSK